MAQLGLDAAEDRAHLSVLAVVAWRSDTFASFASDRARGRFHLRDGSSGHVHGRAGFPETERDALSDSTARAGHERHRFGKRPRHGRILGDSRRALLPCREPQPRPFARFQAECWD